jgi:drug/metabolite transporter (DMT)-like permease
VAAAHNAIAFTTMKNALVALALLGLIIVSGQIKEIRALDRRGRLRLLAVGLIGGAVPFALFFTGLTMVSAVNASLIHKTMFVWIAILAVPFLKEKLSAWQWLGAAAIFGANLLVGGFKGFEFSIGEGMIFAATMLWAVENIVAKRALANVSATTLAAARLTVGSAILIPFLAWQGGMATVVAWGATQWGWVALTAGLLLGFVISWFAALKRAPATYVAALLIPATLVTNVLSAVFVTHQLDGFQILSTALFLAGSALLIMAGRKAQTLSTATA